VLNFFPVVLGLVFPATAADPPADPRVDPAVSPITRYHLRVTTVDGDALPATGWTLTQPDGAAVRAVDVRLRTRAASLTPEGWPYPSTPEHVAIVAFDAPWASRSGSYVLSDGVEQWSFDWDPAVDLAASIHLNPYGGRPDAPDLLALVSTWNVDGPAIALSEQDAWSVVDDATGSEVRAGVWTLREPATTTVDDAYGNSFTRANVYQADLAGLPSGSYHLVWDDVGRSYSFRVADDAWDLPFRTVLGGLLSQRCGIALPPELTDWPRPACHRAAVERTTADYRVVGEDAFDALPAAATGEFVDAPGGYHDAGDYDRNIGHLAVVHALTELYASDPARFAHDALGLPESGNGLPDVLDEAIWAMGPWTALQADDGGVPGGIGTTAYPAYDAMPEDDVGAWYATASDAESSYVYAAAGAALSRSLGAAGQGADAAAWLDRAERAWAWAEAHPASDYDTAISAAHAAAELLWTTGDPTWADAYRTVGPFADDIAWSYAPWDPTVWDDGLWAIANADAAPADLQEAARRVIRTRAEDAVAEADARSVPLAVRPYSAVAFGSATNPRESRILFRAWSLFGDEDYLRVGTETAAHTLGLNATGISYVTGLGPNAVLSPLHTPSLADGIDAAVAGLPVYGPASYTSSGGVLGAALSAYQPPADQWPLHERFADVAYVPQYNEFTVAESLAPTLYAFGFLAALDADAAPDTGDSATDSESDSASDREQILPSSECGCAVGASTESLGVIGLAALLVRRRRS
jgi:endoglucanase